MVTSRDAPIRARLYRKDGARGPGLVVAHGVHYRSIDEKRLVRFARELAASGAVVLTPELGELADYRINANSVEVIAAAVDFLTDREDLLSSPHVGLLGFSFAGGLSLVAATRPEVSRHLSYVASVGGHYDLERVLGFLLHDEVATPDGIVHQKAHEYGLVVLLYQELEYFVDGEDLETLRSAVRAWLHEDKAEAFRLASQRKTASGERIFRLLETSRLGELVPELESRVRARSEELRGLSPRGRLADVPVPVYALHGAGDTVIPPSETAWIERDLRGAPGSHHALVTPLLDHVEVAGKASLADEWALVDFMARLL